VYCLDGLPLDSGEQPPSDHDRHLQELSQRAFQRDPTETIVSAISVRQWLSTLSPDDRTVVALRASGWTLAEIATALESSISRVFARLNELGRALALHADLPVPTRRCHG
jgi:DNA-directed RNA polymerase specialized sigma24 family protein